jgi:non-homologous end joining protein Ku
MPKTARSRLPNKRQATNVIDLVSVLKKSLQKSKSKSAVYRQAGLKKP